MAGLRCGDFVGKALKEFEWPTAFSLGVDTWKQIKSVLPAKNSTHKKHEQTAE